MPEDPRPPNQSADASFGPDPWLTEDDGMSSLIGGIALIALAGLVGLIGGPLLCIWLF